MPNTSNKKNLAKNRNVLAVFGLIVLFNTLTVFCHNRLNAFIYLALVGCYVWLKSLPRLWRDRLIIIFAPNVFTLYYLDFKLLFVSLAADALLLGVWLYLERRK